MLDLLFLAGLLTPIGIAARQGRLRAHAGLLLAATGTGGLSLLMPWVIGDAAFTNLRLPLMAALLGLASVLPDVRAGGWRRFVLPTLILAMVLARSAWIHGIWADRQADFRAVEAVLARVPAGAAVFTVQNEPENVWAAPRGRFLAGASDSFTSNTVLRHVAALAVIERHAFVPTLFSVPGQQPLRVLEPWAAIHTPSSPVPPCQVLTTGPGPEELRHDPYLAHWRRSFDYVLLIGADMENRYGRCVPALPLAAAQGHARLYRIER